MDASLYDELHRVEQTHWWFRARRHIVWSLVWRYVRCEDRGTRSENNSLDSHSSLLTPRLRICELGCGTGGNLTSVADEHDVIGVECSPQALAYARQKLGDRVRYGRLPDEVNLPPQSFDVVLMTDVLEHIEDDAASARSALGLLKPGGIVVATVPAYQWLYSPRDAHHHHFRRYGKARFASLWKDSASQTLLLSHYNTLLFPPAAIVRMASKVAPTRGEKGDVSIPPRLLNNRLAQLMACEANLLGRLPLPFGLSLVAVVQKQAGAHSCSKRSAAA